MCPTGFIALLKCCCPQHEPVYLCESCSLKVSEKDIVSHLTGFDHHKVPLVVSTCSVLSWASFFNLSAMLICYI